MNKQEAIEKIYETDLYGLSPAESKRTIILIVSQIDEPQKVVVPKFVAEWIEECKTKKHSLWCSLEGDSNEVNDWLDETGNEELFALAWIYGYEIEPDPLYTVEIPNPNIDKGNITALKRMRDNNNAIELCVFVRPDLSEPEFQLTESEIKRDFEWAWQFAKEVE